MTSKQKQSKGDKVRGAKTNAKIVQPHAGSVPIVL